MRSVENAGYVKCGVWKVKSMESVKNKIIENTECRK